MLPQKRLRDAESHQTDECELKFARYSSSDGRPGFLKPLYYAPIVISVKFLLRNINAFFVREVMRIKDMITQHVHEFR